MNSAAALGATIIAADAEARATLTAQTVGARRSGEHEVEYVHYASHDFAILREHEHDWQPILSILPTGAIETFRVTNLFPEARIHV